VAENDIGVKITGESREFVRATEQAKTATDSFIDKAAKLGLAITSWKGIIGGAVEQFGKLALEGDRVRADLDKTVDAFDAFAGKVKGHGASAVKSWYEGAKSVIAIEASRQLDTILSPVAGWERTLADKQAVALRREMREQEPGLIAYYRGLAEKVGTVYGNVMAEAALLAEKEKREKSRTEYVDALAKQEQRREAARAAAAARQAARAEEQAAEFELQKFLTGLDEKAEKEYADRNEKNLRLAQARKQMLMAEGLEERKRLEQEAADEARRVRKRSFDQDEEAQALLGGDPFSGRRRAIQGAQQTAQKDFEDGRRGREETIAQLQILNDEMDALGARETTTKAVADAMAGLASAASDAVVAFSMGDVKSPSDFLNLLSKTGSEFAKGQAKLHFAASLGDLAWGNFAGAAAHGAAGAAFLGAAALLGAGASATRPESRGGGGGGERSSAPRSSGRDASGSSFGGGREQQGPSTVIINVAGNAYDATGIARDVLRGMGQLATAGNIPTADVNGQAVLRVSG
jgi:hypothetical protein